MLPAFVLATFGWWSVVTFFLDHFLAFGGVGLVGIGAACIALEIFVPGSIPLIRTALGVVMKVLQWLIGTTAGAFVLVAAACLLTGWGAHSYVDRSAALERQVAAERARTAAAEAAAALERSRALALEQTTTAAARRADAAEAASQDLQEQVDDYADQLADAAKTTPAKAACPHGLTASDVEALGRIGAPRAAH